MKKNIHTLKFMFFACFLLVSCKKEPIIGLGKGPKFPEKLAIAQEGGAATLTAKNKVNWWFAYLEVNGEDVNWEDESLTYFYTKEIDKESAYDPRKQPDIYKIKGKWFSIEKMDNKKITVSLMENQEEGDRKLEIGVQAGNAFGKVTVVQAGRKQ